MKLKSIILYIINLNLKFFIFIELKKFNWFTFLLFYIKNINNIYLIFFFFKKHTFFKFTILSDICVVDYPFKKNRFEVIYNLLSIFYNIRFFFKFFLDINTPILSLTSLYSSVGWLEREVWDLYGIFFFKNFDLRRILTDYGFDYYPFRKDFPLTGYLELRYDDSLNSIVYEPVELTQEYRIFNFINPWELFDN